MREQQHPNIRDFPPTLTCNGRAVGVNRRDASVASPDSELRPRDSDLRLTSDVQVQLSIFIHDNSSAGPVKVHLDKVLKFASAAARP